MCLRGSKKLFCFPASFLVFAIIFAAMPVCAATSQDLVNALGIADQVTSHSLITATETGASDCQISSENALADPGGESVLLSSGTAGDGGFGDTDFACSGGAGEGYPDFTQFQMALDVPGDAMSLVFRTQFISSEYQTQSSEINDRAFLYITLSPGNDQYTIDVSAVELAAGKINPAVLRAVDVDGATQIELSFRIEDNVDGSLDSALKIMGFHFSEASTAGEHAEYLSEDVKLPPGTYRYSKQMLHVPGNGIPLDLTLHYNSRNTRTRYFFRKWTHSYEWYMRELDDGRLLLLTGDGGAIYFCQTAAADIYAECNDAADTSFDNAWEGSAGTVVVNTDGSYTYTNREQLEYGFSQGGFLESIEDPNGNRVELSYFYHQPDGCSAVKVYLDRITDTRGGELQFYYSVLPSNYCQQMLVSMEYRDSEDNALQFLATTYQVNVDCYNREVVDLSYVDAPEGRTVFSYDCSGNLLTGTDPDGIVYRTNTFAGERVAAYADGKGAVASNAYFQDRIAHTDPLGRVHHRYFDIRDRLVRKTDPLGNAWQYSYDSTGNVTSQTDPLGNMTQMTYDNRGNVVSQTDALGQTTTMTYDGHNNLLRLTDAAGYRTDYTYDSSGNLTQETGPMNYSIAYTHDGAGQMQTLTDRRGNVFVYDYSDQGDLLSETNPLGERTEYVYDAEGRMISKTNARGSITTHEYDDAGNLLSLTRPDGSAMSYTYDAQGRQLSVEKANGALTRYTYSNTGKMRELIDPLGNVFSSRYNAADELVAKTDPLGRTTAFEFDAAGRMTRVTDALGGIAEAAYDAAGRRTAITDPNHNTSEFRYDSLGRIIAESDPLGNTTENFYESRGLLDATINGRGQLIEFQYDAAGRHTRTYFPGYILERALDANGNEVQTRGKDGALISRSFDALDRMIRRTDPYGNTITYAYDEAGNLAALTYSDGSVVAYEYDSRDRLVRVTDWDGNETTYTYDAAGNLLSTSLPDGSLMTNTYDPASQLTGISDVAADGSVILRADYQYNEAGLRISAEYHELPLEPDFAESDTDLAYNAANQLTQMNGQAFAYDADGNMTQGVIGGVLKNMEYDALNRLTRAGRDVYEYDPEGLRVQATIAGKTVRYVQDPNAPYSRLLEEHDDQGNIIARYVYGVGLISRQDQAGHVSVYHYDSRGSTIALTNLSGEITDRYAYGPYGEKAGRNGNTTNPFAYNGRDGVMDDGNGLYFMRARYYEPRLMRFIQKDPGSSGNMMDPQSLNRYAYARGNPVQFVDPGGEILPIIIGVGVGVATEIAFDWATGEFNPLEDDWGAYVENNWVDLTIGGVLGAAAPLASLKYASKLKKLGGQKRMASIYNKSKTLLRNKSIRQFTRKTLRKHRMLTKGLQKSLKKMRLGPAVLGNAFEEVFERQVVLPELGISNWTEGAENLYEDHIEGLGGDIKNLAKSTGNAIKDAWNSLW